MRIGSILLSLLLASPFAATAQRLPADGAPQTFNFLSDQYFNDVYFKFSPTTATSTGLHQYDSQLEDYSAAEVQRNIAALHAYENKIAAIDPAALDASVADDRNILLNSIRSQLLTLEVIRGWEKNPDEYSSGVTNSIFVLMERPFASPDTRLHSAIAREKLIPQVFIEARKNLKNPPRIFTEIALEQIDDDISFFQNDVPSAFAAATSTTSKAEFATTNAAVIQSLKDYAAWMKSDLLPRSNGEFRLGPDTFRKKLLFDEMVDIPLDRLLEIAFADLHKNQAEFQRVAHDLDPTKTPQEVLAELDSVHTTPDNLLPSFQATFDNLISYIRSHHIITIPSDVQPTLEETPPFMRATTMASMDSPGPFETHSTKAYFNVTLPEKDWTPKHIEEHMSYYNIGVVNSTAIHEAYPGHYVQFLWQSQFPSKIRKLIQPSTNVEGWAHYCEQMMLDQGYGQPGFGAKDERESKLLRLGQLQDALLRDARFVNSIKLHTAQGEPSGPDGKPATWSIDQAVDFFIKQGYQPAASARVETKRGTADPTYLYYTLGKLEIMKLREDLKAKQGTAFNLQDFHDNFMRQGPAPIKIIRKAMLHNDTPVL